MSKDTDTLLTQITEEIDAKELDKVSSTNKRVDEAYGSGGRGLIVPTQVIASAKPDDIF